MIKKGPIGSAQSIVEYVAVIIVVIAVFIAAGKYYQRSLQGRFRQAGDVIGAGEQSPDTFKLNLE
jgi:Flp pilus assembly pilin Flp